MRRHASWNLCNISILNMVRDLRSKGVAAVGDAIDNELSEEVKLYLEALMESQTDILLGRITALEEKLLERILSSMN